jgi:hypothetical protein
VTAVDRFLVDTAVAISPPGHREARREQWHADLRDAAEVGLSPTALAVGAFTTALFHRRGARRTTWGDTMTTTPSSAPAVPHMTRTVPLLIAVAVFAITMIGPWLILQPNYGYESTFDRTVGTTGTWLALYLVPGAAVTLAVLLLTGTTPRRRRLGAAMVAAAAVAAVVFVSVPLGTRVPVEVLPPLVALAGWLVAVEADRRSWLVLLLPVAAIALLVSGLPYAVVPVRLAPCLSSLPELAVVAAGLIAWPTSRVRRRTRRASTSVEQHRDEEHAVALVDKTV